MGATEEALHRAYAGEAKAALRLKVFAEKAEADGYPQLAKLFAVVAYSEEIHGVRALKLLKAVGTTEENLVGSFAAETGVAQVAYDGFVRLAEEAGNRAAAIHFRQSYDVEAVHAKLYKEAMTHLLEERETSYYVCKICGYISDGILPEVCPVCEATADQFVAFP